MAITSTRYLIPAQSYDFQVRIGDKDYTAELQEVAIITSMLTPIQSFVLDFFLDPNDLILDKVHGKDKIVLTLRLLGAEGVVEDKIDIDLVFLSTRPPMMMKTTNPQQEMKNRTRVTITASPLKAFSSMYSIVNGLYFGETIQSIIGSSVNQIPSKPTLNFDTNGVNTEKFDQVIIPPTTFHKSVQYLDQTFGIYNGVFCCFCLFDGNIYIKNISDSIKRSHLLTIHLLAADAKEEETMKKPMDGTIFYTRSDIYTEYLANSSLGVYGAKQRHIFKPNDELYTNVDFNTETIASQYGLISGSNKKIDYDQDAMGMSKSGGRLTVFSDRLGYNKNTTPAYARSSRWLSEISNISINLSSKYITMLNFMHVGEAVKFETKISDYNGLRGKYILKNVSFRCRRVRQWEIDGTVNLIRTNRLIN